MLFQRKLVNDIKLWANLAWYAALTCVAEERSLLVGGYQLDSVVS